MKSSWRRSTDDIENQFNKHVFAVLLSNPNSLFEYLSLTTVIFILNNVKKNFVNKQAPMLFDLIYNGRHIHCFSFPFVLQGLRITAGVLVTLVRNESPLSTRLWPPANISTSISPATLLDHLIFDF